MLPLTHLWVSHVKVVNHYRRVLSYRDRPFVGRHVSLRCLPTTWYTNHTIVSVNFSLLFWLPVDAFFTSNGLMHGFHAQRYQVSVVLYCMPHKGGMNYLLNKGTACGYACGINRRCHCTIKHCIVILEMCSWGRLLIRWTIEAERLCLPAACKSSTPIEWTLLFYQKSKVFQNINFYFRSKLQSTQLLKIKNEKLWLQKYNSSEDKPVIWIMYMCTYMIYVYV